MAALPDPAAGERAFGGKRAGYLVAVAKTYRMRYNHNVYVGLRAIV